MTVWGGIFLDHWNGLREPHFVGRDDGRREVVDSAAGYFEAPRSDAERELLQQLAGPVLDLAAGAGSYSLFLQDRGLEVTAADSAPGALEVCRLRGCLRSRLLDLRNLSLTPSEFQSIIVMGNTLGAHQTPESLPRLLAELARALRPRGRLLFHLIDPEMTDDPDHLRYHQRNRDRGLPPGLVRMRMEYRDEVEDWMNLWMPTDGELSSVMEATGWRLVDERKDGPNRVSLYSPSSR